MNCGKCDSKERPKVITLGLSLLSIRLLFTLQLQGKAKEVNVSFLTVQCQRVIKKSEKINPNKGDGNGYGKH